MFSIGELSKRTGVKVPTIRYYEQSGLIAPTSRTEGNQRRYGEAELDRLKFVRHARDLGFSLASITALIELHDQPDRSCSLAGDIARQQLDSVRAKLARLARLEAELARIAEGCEGGGAANDCHVLKSLADHSQCETDHR